MIVEYIQAIPIGAGVALALAQMAGPVVLMLLLVVAF